MVFHDHHHRTFFKSVSWFIVGFAVSFFVLLYFTGNFNMSLIEASAIQALKFIFFYIHERVWNKSDFGQIVKDKHSK
ncbi:DUF2061 domain-containing protein [bacterium]|nr:DUF2061 domain-containing protein [bacterium]MBT3730028.1 DUF2061 domain-containing protein [bacterium]MBT4895004.1 DUF2061 domain-containing protein [bacterium]